MVLTKIVIIAHALIFLLLIPMLEIGNTHLLNPDWPAHARLHEAWQLLTNASLAGAAVLILWRARHAVAALLLDLALSLSFIVAWLLETSYGGSMLHTDGTQVALYGINIAVLLMLVLAVMTLAVLRVEMKRAETR